MKWLSKLFKGGSTRGGASSSGGGSRHPQFIGDENMSWRSPIRSVV